MKEKNDYTKGQGIEIVFVFNKLYTKRKVVFIEGLNRREIKLKLIEQKF